MKRNKNVIIVEKDVRIAKGVFLSEGDALVKTRNGWTLIEAEGDADKDENEIDVDENEDEDDKFDEEDEDEEVI